MHNRSPNRWAKIGETIGIIIVLLAFVAFGGFVCWIGYSVYTDIANQKPRPKQRYYSPPDFKEWKPADPPYSTGRY